MSTININNYSILNMKTSILVTFLCISISIYAQEGKMVDNDQQFLDFLENSLESDIVNDETAKNFHQRSMAYWKEHIYDYNLHPEKYDIALSLFYQNQQKYKQNNSIKIDRYKDAIDNFCRFDNRNTLAKNPILFIGSSSIVHWETSLAFPEFPIINRGFGGASLPEIIHYYDDIIKKHSPSIMVVYCDIDIERGKSPREAVNSFKELVSKVKKDFPKTQIILLSMKPTLIDDFLGKDVNRNKIITNTKLIEYCNNEKNLHFVDITNPMLKSDDSLRSDIFLSDGMHLNPLGYTLWNPVVREEIAALTKQK